MQNTLADINCGYSLKNNTKRQMHVCVGKEGQPHKHVLACSSAPSAVLGSYSPQACWKAEQTHPAHLFLFLVLLTAVFLLVLLFVRCGHTVYIAVIIVVAW